MLHNIYKRIDIFPNFDKFW